MRLCEVDFLIWRTQYVHSGLVAVRRAGATLCDDLSESTEFGAPDSLSERFKSAVDFLSVSLSSTT
jgi:hypothetical protein